MQGFIDFRAFLRRMRHLHPRACGDLSLKLLQAYNNSLIPARAGIYRSVGRGRKYSVIILIPARAGIYRDVSLLVLAVLSLSPRVREFIVLIERSMGGKVLIPARAGIYRSGDRL